MLYYLKLDSYSSSRSNGEPKIGQLVPSIARYKTFNDISKIYFKTKTSFCFATDFKTRQLTY